MPELGPLDGAVRTLEQCIDRGLTRSAQVAVRHRGEWIANGAVGTTGSGGGPPSQDTAYVWSCATKPLAAIIIGTLIDEGALDVDEPLGRFLPELPVHLSRITISELLTHTATLSDVGAGNFCLGRNVDYARGSPEAALAAIVDAPMEADVAAGTV